MSANQVTLTIRFPSEEELVEWFQATRSVGCIEDRAGVRRKDALDPGSRAGKGEFIVASDGAVEGWLVEPDLPVPIDPGQPLTHLCECGHQAFWHGGSEGSCEHDDECRCQAFTLHAREEVTA